MQLARIESFSWPQEGVHVEMRRHLSGKYRAYMDTEIITALLFQYLGMRWSTEFKSAFRGVEARCARVQSRETFGAQRVFQGAKNVCSSFNRGTTSCRAGRYVLHDTAPWRTGFYIPLRRGSCCHGTEGGQRSTNPPEDRQYGDLPQAGSARPAYRRQNRSRVVW